MITIDERRERIHELRNEGVSIPATVYTALDQDRAPSDLLRSWTWSSHLWARPTARVYVGLEGSLASDQADWDAAHQSISGSLELRAERHARAVDESRQRQAEDAATRTAEAGQIKTELRERFLRLPGTTVSEFEAAFPALLSDHRRQEMQRNDDGTRHELQRLGRAGL